MQVIHHSDNLLIFWAALKRHTIILLVKAPQPKSYSWTVWISSAIATLHWLVVLYLKSNSMCMFFYEFDFRLLCIFIFWSYFCCPKSIFLLESLFIMHLCRIFFLYGRADSSLSLLALFSFHNTDSLTVCGTNFFLQHCLNFNYHCGENGPEVLNFTNTSKIVKS